MIVSGDVVMIKGVWWWGDDDCSAYMLALVLKARGRSLELTQGWMILERSLSPVSISIDKCDAH